MRTYTAETVTWPDGYVSVNLYDNAGWAGNIGATPDGGPVRTQLEAKLQSAGFKNATWDGDELQTCTRDEYSRERDLAIHLLGDVDHLNLPAPDQPTERHIPENIDEPEPDKRTLELHARQVALEDRINELLPDGLELSFTRHGGYIYGFGHVPVQATGFIGPNAKTIDATDASNQAFYFRLRSNKASFETFWNRGIPRDTEPLSYGDGIDDPIIEADTAAIGTMSPVIEGDDYLGSLPGGVEENAALFVKTIENLAPTDPWQNPTYAEAMTHTLLLRSIATALQEGGVEAADQVARERLNTPVAVPYAQQWLDRDPAEKQHLLDNIRNDSTK